MEEADDTDQSTPLQTDEQDKVKRFRSEIEFPYSDLESAIELAHTIHHRAGSSCEAEELAAWMNQSASGGTFRSRLSAARIFGLVETGQGRVALTQLGRDAIDKNEERHARVDAFLCPDLYRQMYEQHRGNTLPPPAAIERQMEQLGVSPKQKDRARQVFMKSATFAGFVDTATGRFVKPGNGGPKEPIQSKDETKIVGRSNGNGGGHDLELDPLLIALLKKIPQDRGWPGPQRLRWFRTFAMNVSQIYDDDNEPVELDIKMAQPEGN